MKHSVLDQINLLSELVAYNTIDGNTESFERSFELVDRHLKQIGLTQYEYSYHGVKSAVWTNATNHLQPDILLSAHIDVVPGEDSQFTVQKKGQRLYGRGVSDMKFSIVSFIHILEELFEENKMPPSIGIMITSDEEVSGLFGTGHLINDVGYRPKLVVLPDGGENLELVIGAKGVLSLRIISTGVPAHSALPWEGENAIDNLINFLIGVRQLIPNPVIESWENTINSGQIAGGIQLNQICDHAEALLDIRFIPQTIIKDLVSNMQRLSSKISIEITDIAEPFYVDSSNHFLIQWKKIVEPIIGKKLKLNYDHGTSDARFFSPHNIPVIMTKPLAYGDHSTDEWLDIPSWQTFNQCLKELLLTY